MAEMKREKSRNIVATNVKREREQDTAELSTTSRVDRRKEV
jgi:hypothetical protein